VESVGGALVIIPGPRISAFDNADEAGRRGALIEALRNTTASAVVVDFAHVGYFGSLLLDTLCVVWKQVRERSGRMALCNLSEVATEILAKSKLNSLWPIYASRQAAIEALTRAPTPSQVDASRDSRLFRDFRDDACSRLQVQESGRRTVVGFGGCELPPDYILSRYLPQIISLIDEHDCQEFAFNLAGVSAVPSGFLGVVASILNKGVRVSVRNSSREVREVLVLTNLDRCVQFEEFE